MQSYQFKQSTDYVLPSAWENSDYNAYAISLSRKAKSHSFNQYKFAPEEKLNEPRQEQQNKTKKQKKQKITSNGGKSIIIKNFKQKLESKHLKNLKQSVKDNNVNIFMKVQREVLIELQNKPFLIPFVENKFSNEMLKIEKFFIRKNNPNAANDELFQLLQLETNRDHMNSVNFFKQLHNIKGSIDRDLDLKSHPACKGFLPTSLQRSVMHKIDEGKNIILRAPTGTGKTMISLYMAQKMKNNAKTTVYIGPTKPVCNEFGIFVYYQGLKQSISTEDFMSWGEVQKATEECGVLICTPALFFEMLMYPSISFVSSIGAIIFDELPKLLDSNFSETALLLLISQAFHWQTMVMSATMSNSIIDTLYNFNSFTLLDSGNSIRPTDLVLQSYDSKTKNLQLIPTSSTYTNEFHGLPYEEKLEIAKRVPITLSEVKNISNQIGEDEFNSICNLTLQPKVLKGIDLTKIALSKTKPSASIEKLQNCSNQSDDESSDSEDNSFDVNENDIEEECKELLDFMYRLGKENLLPVMIFHSNRTLLTKYHKKCSKLLIEEEKNQLKIIDAHNLKVEKLNKKSVKIKKEDPREEAEKDTKYYVSPFGQMEKDDLKEFFKHRGDRLRYAGKTVMASEYYDGIRRGLGIYHHGVDKHSRTAVESGLRCNNINVVFSDSSLAFGLNLPVKTVLFLNSKFKNNKMLSPEKLVQASGRAGRWSGNDSNSVGNIVLYNMDPTEKENLLHNFWKPYSEIPTEMPLDALYSLRLITSKNSQIQKILPSLFSFNIPQWNWNQSTKNLLMKHYFDLCLQYQFISPKCNLPNINNIDTFQSNDLQELFSKYRITNVGKCVLSCGKSGLFAGFLVSNYFEILSKSIKSIKDFIFVVTHFIPRWRTKVSKIRYINIGNDLVNKKLKKFMNRTSIQFSVDNPNYKISSKKISSFYIDYPNFGKHKICKNDAQSLFAHFYAKASLVQRYTNLPYGDEFLVEYEQYL